MEAIEADLLDPGTPGALFDTTSWVTDEVRQAVAGNPDLIHIAGPMRLRT